MAIFNRVLIAASGYIIYNKLSNAGLYNFKLMHSSVCENSFDSKKLIFSSIYFRHGTRTPLGKLKLFPDLIWNEELCKIDTSENYLPFKVVNQDNGVESCPPSYLDNVVYKSQTLPGGCAGGQLTQKGQQLSYDLGKRFRDRYVDNFNLFDGKYNPNIIGSYSTNMDRTIHSMQAVLKGLFEDTISQENIAIIGTRPNEIEHNFPNKFFSEKINKWTTYVYASQYSFRVCDELREKLTQLYPNSSDIPEPTLLWENLSALKSNDFEVPPEYAEIMDLVEKCTSHVEKHAVFSDTPANMKLISGKVIDDIIVHMENASKHYGKSEYFKLWLTSCHDTTILSLLTAMGGFNEKLPPLSSYIAFELYRDTTGNNNYVRVIFNGDVIRSGGCDKNGFMTLEEFVKKHDKIRLDKFEENHFGPFLVAL